MSKTINVLNYASGAIAAAGVIAASCFSFSLFSKKSQAEATQPPAVTATAEQPARAASSNAELEAVSSQMTVITGNPAWILNVQSRREKSAAQETENQR